MTTRELTPAEQRFIDGYIECALWSTSGPDDEDNLEECKLAEPTRLQMVADCIAFRNANESDLSQAGSDEQNGHDFWLTRERHGAGFWDRGYPEKLGQRLTDAAHAYGGFELYVGDDELVYAMGYETYKHAEPKKETTP